MHQTTISGLPILKEIAFSILIKWFEIWGTWLCENSYGFTSIAHIFLKQSSQIENFFTNLEIAQNDNFWRGWDKLGDLF